MTDCDTYRVPTPNGRSAVTGRFNPPPTAGDTTPISDEAITRLIKAFYEAHGVESWESSAEYRYGAEHHWMREALAETAPLLVSSDSSAQAERTNAERREREALIGRLRAELAERDRELAHLFAQLRNAVRVDEWRVPPKDTAEIVSVAMETLAKHWDCGDDL